MTSALTTVKDEMTEYWDAGFLAAEAKPGTFYDLKKLPAITQASHFRRMALLDGLPLGDLRDKVCVDYGVGPWGFACVFPKLHHCREAIGFDLSPEAVRISEGVSRDGDYAYGDRVRYLTSTGSSLDLPDASVDVLFAGESIEHVFNVDAFLDEVYRVLTPDGRFILTTPNADACLYRAHNERYCHNAEHVSLMSYPELRALVDTRFDILVAKGFNGSLYRGFDDLADEDFAHRWTETFADRPDLASGVVLMATPRSGYAAPPGGGDRVPSHLVGGLLRRLLGPMHAARAPHRGTHRRSIRPPHIELGRRRADPVSLGGSLEQPRPHGP